MRQMLSHSMRSQAKGARRYYLPDLGHVLRGGQSTVTWSGVRNGCGNLATVDRHYWARPTTRTQAGLSTTPQVDAWASPRAPHARGA